MSEIYKDYEEKFIDAICSEEATTNFDLIKKLKNEKIKIALVTTCRWFFINKLIEYQNLENIFDFIVAREDVPHDKLKPDPLAYLMAIEKMGLNKNECLSIEDSKRGVDAAINAGIPVIKVDNFTSVKYSYPEVVEMDSAKEVLEKVLSR